MRYFFEAKRKHRMDVLLSWEKRYVSSKNGEMILSNGVLNLTGTCPYIGELLTSKHCAFNGKRVFLSKFYEHNSFYFFFIFFLISSC